MIDIPTLDELGDFPIDVAQLIAHTLVQANSGGGKTYAVRRVLEQVWGAMPQWVIDPEGEMHTLRERFPLLLAAPHGGDTVASVKAAPMLARRLLETGASCVIDIYDMGVDERHEFMRVFAEAAMNQPRALWRDILVVVDEAHRFIPERGEDPSVALGAMKNWMTAGRKRGYAMILAVQRLSTLHKSAAAECNNRLIGRTGLDTDQDRAGKALGLRSAADKEALARLKPGAFWVYGPAFCERPTLATIGPIQTSHGRAARGKAPTPPLEEARKYLAQIGDLPAEAEAELKTVEQLKARVRELEAAKTVTFDASGLTSIEMTAALQRDYDKRIENLQRRLDATEVERDTLRHRLEVFSAGSRRIAEKFDEVSKLMDELCSNDALDRTPPPAARVASDDLVESMAKSTHPIARMVGGIELVKRRDRREAGDLSPLQRALLTALAQHGLLSKGKALLHAGYSSSGDVSKCWAQMTRDGWIASDQGIVDITQKGRNVLGDYEPLPVGRALLDKVLGKLPTIERRLLKVVADEFPRQISKGDALQIAGYKSSGDVSKAWAHLCALDYIKTYRGLVAAAKELCVP